LNPAGQAPGYLYDALSFVFQDHFYVFGGGGSGFFDGITYVLNFGILISRFNLLLLFVETMTWKKIRQRSELGENGVEQCLYRDHVMTLIEYHIDWDLNMDQRNYDEKRKMSTHHMVSFWKINPNGTGTSDEVRRSKKISLDYWLKRTPVIYDNYMLNFGIRWVAEEVMEFCMFALDLNCK